MRASPVPPELRSATGRIIRPVDRTYGCRHDTRAQPAAVTSCDQLGRPSMVGENGHRTTLPTLLRTPRTANAGHVMRPAARTIPGDVMSLGHDPTVCRHDTSYAGMVRENGPRTTLPLLLRGLVPERVPGVSDQVVHSLTKTIVDLQRVMLDHRAGRLHGPCPFALAGVTGPTCGVRGRPHVPRRQPPTQRPINPARHGGLCDSADGVRLTARDVHIESSGLRSRSEPPADTLCHSHAGASRHSFLRAAPSIASQESYSKHRHWTLLQPLCHRGVCGDRIGNGVEAGAAGSSLCHKRHFLIRALAKECPNADRCVRRRVATHNRHDRLHGLLNLLKPGRQVRRVPLFLGLLLLLCRLVAAECAEPLASLRILHVPHVLRNTVDDRTLQRRRAHEAALRRKITFDGATLTKGRAIRLQHRSTIQIHGERAALLVGGELWCREATALLGHDRVPVIRKLCAAQSEEDPRYFGGSAGVKVSEGERERVAGQCEGERQQQAELHGSHHL
mmetsp:Transcript_42800/g.106725  ORF Transcript_42800/g.106725 Transcript_42800/m.106725 type:complete len:505 (+) Transcript_42800:37-1551(+)